MNLRPHIRVMGRRVTDRFQRGLSLVEIMIALLLSLVLMAGVVSIYLGTKQTYRAQDSLSRIQENGRFAIDIIARDLRRAGYWGGNRKLSTIGGAPGPVAAASTCETGDDTWGRMLGQRIYGLNDTSAGYACVTNQLRGDILVVRYASDDVVSEGSIVDSRPYLRTTVGEGKVVLGSTLVDEDGNPVADNAISGFGDGFMVTRRVVAHGYFIRNAAGQASCTDVGGMATALNVPALWRVEIGANGRPTPVELVRGVEDMQVYYGVRDDDGNLVAYKTATQVEADGEWNDVSAVRVWFLVRSECPEAGLDPVASYDLGGHSHVPVDPAGAAFRRYVYTTTVAIRN